MVQEEVHSPRSGDSLIDIYNVQCHHSQVKQVWEQGNNLLRGYIGEVLWQYWNALTGTLPSRSCSLIPYLGSEAITGASEKREAG